jgi:hypothetical protein
MARLRYATQADLDAYPVDVAEADADRLVAEASSVIDDALDGAVYPVDDAGMPTEQKHREALAEATCAVIAWWDAIGDDGSGATLRIQSASIAGVSLGIRQPPPGAKPDRAGSAARRILREAGLLGGGGPDY